MKKNKIPMPLYEAVEGYRQEGRARFHMPGHKGNFRGGPTFFRELLPYDITEVQGADSLFHAQGAILKLEGQLANLYGAEQTLLCAGGATLCIQTMLTLACGTGGVVIAGRNLHRSAVNAMVLLDLRPVWVYPAGDAGEGYLGRYTPEDVAEALHANPQAKAVYITSPDYYGVVSDISAIGKVCEARGVPLLVDNAHGAHLKFLGKNWECPHPMDCGAHMCADSLHKTMPAMTGAALLHLCKKNPGAKQAMALFGSTSPSYPLMLSAEWAGAYGAGEGGAEFNETALRLETLRNLARQKGFRLPEGRTDPLKLSLGFGHFNMEPEAFEEYLRKNGVEPEYTGGFACVLMANGYNTPQELDCLERAISNFPALKDGVWDRRKAELPRCEQVCTLREAFFLDWEMVDVSDSPGRIAARDASPCPPGIPVVMGGEEIHRKAAEFLRTCGMKSIPVLKTLGTPAF